MNKRKAVTKICRHCGAEIPREAKICPDCGQKVKRVPLQAGVIAAVLIVLLTALFGGRGGSQQKNGAGSTDTAGKIGEIGKDREAESPGTMNENGKGGSPAQGEENGNGNGNDNADGSSIGIGGSPGSGEASAPSVPLQEIYRVGDVLQDGDMRITYIASGEYQEENEYLQPEDGYRYIFLKFAFENTSEKRNRSVSFYSFRCYADGFAAQAYYGGEKDLSASLSPGRAATGYIYFSVPQDAEDIDIEYETNFLTSEKLHFAYEGEKDSGYALPANTQRNAHALRPGEIVESGTLRITYESCEKDDSGSDFFRPASGCSFYTLTFEFENTGTTDQSVSIYDFHCYADGAGCAASWHRDDYLSADISGGRKAKGTVTFEVPDDAQTVEAEYDANYWTNDRIVFTVR